MYDRTPRPMSCIARGSVGSEMEPVWAMVLYDGDGDGDDDDGGDGRWMWKWQV